MSETVLPPDYFSLYDYRQAVLSMYGERNNALHAGENPDTVCERFRVKRDELFGTHPQSAIVAEERPNFGGLKYFAYDPTAVVDAVLENAKPDPLPVATSGDTTMPLVRVATLHFRLWNNAASLTLFWIDIYGGGLFLPFRDASAPEQTYGGARYLFDTIKGSDSATAGPLGGSKRLQLDFNYAYNPSCAYDPRWACPLAPPENRLSFPIRAGERKWQE